MMHSMMRMLLILFPAAVAAATVDSEDALQGGFSTWASQHRKQYPTETHRLQRFAVWQSNRQYVSQHNEQHSRGVHSYRLGMNKFADLTNEEYRRTVLGLRPKKQPTHPPSQQFRRGTQSVPDSWDWRPLGVVTEVKNQAQCGSCWAFSAVATMEGAYNKKHNGSVAEACAGTTCGPNDNPCCSFSEQEVVDCTLKGACNCKKGGEMHDGIMEIAKQMGGSINTEKQYPYQGTSKGVCKVKKASAVPAGITGYANVTYGDEEALKQAAYQYPVISIGIDASSMNFQLYADGVYNNPSCKKKPAQLDHGVAIVGYGTATGPSPGPPGPPGPGPADCPDNTDQNSCNNETGCHWCLDPIGKDGFCFSFPCDSQQQEVAMQQKGQDYWIVKNSWGAEWGIQGYIWMSRNKDNQCGVASDATYALID